MPSDTRSALQTIVVAGDGAIGLAAAIALRRALPRAKITMVPCAPDAAAFADHATTSLPSSNLFHARLGLDEVGFVLRAAAGHRLATRFTGWTTSGSWLHAYGASSNDADVPSVSQALAADGRFAHPADDTTSPLSDIDYALRFNAEGYAHRLSGLANHLGVIREPSVAISALPDVHSGIASIQLANGVDLTADLFIDCTGPSAILSRAAGAVFESWADQLPCNRVMRTTTPEPPALSVVDEVTAWSQGWRSRSFARDGTRTSIGYQSSPGSDTEATNALGSDPADAITFTPGRLRDAWSGNVVAIGDAAATFDPLHGANMALAHAHIVLLLDLLPSRNIIPLERDEYNRRASAMSDRVRDYIALYHCGPKPPHGPFWSYASSLKRSDALSLTLEEYKKRGRLPFFEDDILPRDAWVSAMACVGILPGKSALAQSASPEAVERHTKTQTSRSTAATGMAPPYQLWLSNYIETQK